MNPRIPFPSDLNPLSHNLSTLPFFTGQLLFAYRELQYMPGGNHPLSTARSASYAPDLFMALYTTTQLTCHTFRVKNLETLCPQCGLPHIVFPVSIQLLIAS